MHRAGLAKLLISTPTDAGQRLYFAKYPNFLDEKLALAIRKACYSAWAVEPVKAQRAAAALKILSAINENDQIRANAAWVRGISDITRGKFASAVTSLDKAARILIQTGHETESAQTQVAMLLALAMLGRYDQAIVIGKHALTVFVSTGDELAAGKIEMNLSNIVSRQAKHRDAKKYCASARRRFIKAGEKGWQAMAENGLANTYAELNEFDRAEKYYKLALAGARSEKMTVTAAEIEASLGNLALLRGRYADALRFLELSRQKYAALGMPHQSAIADLEIADIYLDLNLLTEADDIYSRVSADFQKLGMRSEEARSRLNHGRTATDLNQVDRARAELTAALRLYRREKNHSGEVSTLLARGDLSIRGGNLKKALSFLGQARTLISEDDNPRHEISLELLEGQALAGSGDYPGATISLNRTIDMARRGQQSNSYQAALTTLGNVSLAIGDNKKALLYFSKAIRKVEELRSPLTADEFSMGFLASRLEPFENLANLYLSDRKYSKAFEMIERGRSRSLLDAFDQGSSQGRSSPKLEALVRELRTELNFYYKRLDRASSGEVGKLKSDIREAESKLASTRRQISSLSAMRISKQGDVFPAFNLKDLQKQLGPSQILIEFIESGGAFSAFIITGDKIRFFANIATVADVEKALEDLHFQFGSLRYGTASLGQFEEQIKKRTDRYLARLYQLLMAPLKKHLAAERFVIIPVGPLHYVPFHALCDDGHYIVEQFEIGYAPSAAVWSKLQTIARRKVKNALLMGFADERIPLVEKEIRGLSRILPGSKSLMGAGATVAAFLENAPKYDLIHLACHGMFRHDNPMFSSLHMADGWITVQDISSVRLRADMVTLSACETGLNKLFAGDEILGLVRGFLIAGVSSLVVSLWTVNDEATGRLMSSLYKNVQRGHSVAASLRQAQIEFIARGDHAFLWSPFVSIGR